MSSAPEVLERIQAGAEAATAGPWEVGDRSRVAGLIKADRCAYCTDDSEPSWVGRRDINGRKMTAHVHRAEPFDGDTSIYAKREDGGLVVALSTREYVSIDAHDAAFIAAARTDVPALASALWAVLALHFESEDGDCDECHGKLALYDTYPCETVVLITAALSATKDGK